MMDEWKHNYLRLCKDHNIEPQECVLAQFKSSQVSKSGTAVLNLSTHSLAVKTCAVLGKLLTTDRVFREIKLCDCMLTEDAVKAIAHGLASNVACKKLDLKGNNIRGTATEAVGRMIRQNKHLLSICLEWNALGMLDQSFSVLCEGIGANTCLQALDLRNNQINHDGATELAGAIKRNTTLKILDLRWNNIGLVGGRAMLTALQSNRTLCKLDLAGNNIPNDVAKALGTATGHNADHQSLTNDYYERTHMLSNEMKMLKKEKLVAMGDLMDKIDQQEDILRRTSTSSAHRIGQLQEALEERKAAFHNLAAKLSMTESELALAETRANDLGALLTRAKQENADIASNYQSEVKRGRVERANNEGKLLREISEGNDRCVQLETKVDELERRCKQQQQQIYDLKEQLTHAQADVKVKGSQFDERLQAEKQKGKEDVRDAEQIKQKEINRIRQEADDTERSLRERIQKFDLHRMELEEEISKLKTASVNDKMQAEEHLMVAKQRIKLEEEQRSKQLGDKIHLLQTGKMDLEKHCTQQTSLVSELQAKNSSLILEVETYKRRMDETNQELAGKNNEMMQEVGKVRIELNQQINRLQSEHQSQSELMDKISKLDKQLADQTIRHRDALHEKETELGSLTERLRMKDAEINAMRDEETQRVSALQSAVMNYVSRSPYKPR